MIVFIAGTITGAAIVILWALSAAKKKDPVIEKEDPEIFDVTPQMAIAAYNVLRQHCEAKFMQECRGCIFDKGQSCSSVRMFNQWPCEWPDLEVSDNR